MYGILSEGQVEIVDDAVTWARWFETADRVVAKTSVNDAEVSTVFLGINHNFLGGRPLWFQTMVFGGSADGQMDRYATLEEARRGHERMVQLVKETTE